MLAQALSAGTIGLTESQFQIAEGLGWKDELEFSPFRELVQYLDEVFKRITTKEPVSVQIPEMSTAAEVGKRIRNRSHNPTLPLLTDIQTIFLAVRKRQ